MTYIEEFEAIKTVKELYLFRDKLKNISRQNSGWGFGSVQMEACQEAHYFTERVEDRIIYLQEQGIFLDGISKDNSLPPPER